MLERDKTGSSQSWSQRIIFMQLCPEAGKERGLEGKPAISWVLRLLKLEVPHGCIGSLPHKGKVPLQLFVGVCEGVVLRDAAQFVCSRGSEGPVAAHQNGAHSRRPDLFFNSILGPDANPGPPDSEFYATSLEQETHEVTRASNCNYGYKT